MKGSGILARAILCAALASPAAPAAPSAATKVWVRGELTTDERAPLPQDSVAVVELREAPRQGAPAKLEPVAVRRQVLSGGQVPVSFTVDASREDLSKERAYVVYAAITVSGRPLWSVTSRPLELEDDYVNLGRLTLASRPQPLPRTLRCGPRRATVRAGDVAELSAGPRRFVLSRASSGSGVKYELPAAAPTLVWFKGDRAQLVVVGEEWDECTVEPFRARGNEPGWRLEIDAASLRFASDEARVEVGAPRVEGSSAAARYVARAQGGSLAVTIFERPCVDAMSGMPYPQAVEVGAFGKTYRGCGGEPSAMLQGQEWLVHEIVPGFPGPWRITMSFAADGRVYGQGPCNPYDGGYTLTGEALHLSLGAAAHERCAPAVLKQEQELFDLLQKTERFEVGRDGTLVLHTSDGRRVSARGRAVQ